MTFNPEEPYDRAPYGNCHICGEPKDLGPDDEPKCFQCPSAQVDEVDATARPGD